MGQNKILDRKKKLWVKKNEYKKERIVVEKKIIEQNVWVEEKNVG